ncbi:MAG: hypothetical protein HGA28_04915 [Anaerolineaceae bacterium]|nr:hypothetical protein [Anaerolineaceae bacterium]
MSRPVSLGASLPPSSPSRYSFLHAGASEGLNGRMRGDDLPVSATMTPFYTTLPPLAPRASSKKSTRSRGSISTSRPGRAGSAIQPGAFDQ